MKRRGFTLIELLAVIVILAIIAVIATPIIVGIIEDSRKAAFERSVEGIIHATDLDFGTQETLTNNEYKIENGQIDKTLKTPIKNIEGFNGKIKYDEKGNSTYAIHNGKWCVKKLDIESSPEVSDYNEADCKLVLPLSEDCFETEDLENGGVAIVNYLCTETDVIIPDTINGKVVKEISGKNYDYGVYDEDYYGAFQSESCNRMENQYYYCENQLTSVKIPSSVTKIGDFAFTANNLSGELDLSHLTNLTSIGESAFYQNKLSGELDLSHLINLTNIGSEAFGGDWYTRSNQITSIKLPSSIISIGERAFYANNLSDELDLSYLTNLTAIEDESFGENSITSLKLPSNIISIGRDAFLNNKLNGKLDLSYLTNLTSIGDNAFYGQSDGSTNQITALELPDSVVNIGNRAFQYNILSGELDLSNTSLTSIGNSAFVGEYDGSTNQITSLKLPNSLTSIGDSAFEYNIITGELDLSNTKITSIGDAFSMNRITSLKLPNTLTNIDNWAFNGSSITSVTFYGRNDLTGVTIGTRAFGSGFNDSNIYFEN